VKEEADNPSFVEDIPIPVRPEFKEGTAFTLFLDSHNRNCSPSIFKRQTAVELFS